MGLFRRRHKPQGVPTYTNAAVIERIARENGVDHETARRVIHHQPTGEPDPTAYARAFEARSGSGAMDTTIWAIPAAAAVAGESAPSEPAEDRGDSGQDVGGTIEDHGSDWGESSSSDSGSSDSGGGSSCGGGGG